MEITITHKEDVPLMKRTEVEARISYQGATPSRKEVVAAVAKAINGKKDHLIVKSVMTQYGNQAAIVKAYHYSDRKVLEKLEQQSMIKKNTFAEEKKAEEPAETTKVEAAEPEKTEGDA